MTTKNWKEIVAAVTEDIRCHKENGVSLNPYSTVGARASWQNGFEGKASTITDRLDCYQRGKVAAQLIKEVHNDPT